MTEWLDPEFVCPNISQIKYFKTLHFSF